MIPNCLGCQAELEMLYEGIEQGFYFAGEGLYEKGHLFLRLVDDNGKIIVE